MNGIIQISVHTRRVAYELELRHNITVIQGDSGSGKSVLCDLVSRKSNRQGSAIALTVTNNYACRHLTNEMCEDGALSRIKNSIVFLDEDCDFIYSNDFAQQILGSSNYFVLITRHIKRLSKLSIHVNALCKLVYLDGINHLEIEHHLAEDKTYLCGDIFAPDKIITEDSNSGYKFFKLVAGDKCRAAKGRSKFVSQASELFKLKQKYLIIADGGAFGGDINQVIYTLSRLNLPGFAFYLPDSFEEVLLHSLIFKNKSEIINRLREPWNYIDYSKCISFEQFYTDLLISSASAMDFAYSKTGPLSNRFTSEVNQKHIISQIQHVDFRRLSVPCSTAKTTVFK